MAGKSRNSSLELLRIIAMFGIVLHHYSFHGGMFEVPGVDLSTLTIAAGASLGKWGVDIFILMTGYFLSADFPKQKLLRHLLKFYVQVWTTSVLCLAAAFLFTGKLPPKAITGIFPIGYDMWWFATGYFLLLVFSPFLNILLAHLSKRQHQNLIFIMVFLWSVLIIVPGTFYGYSPELVIFPMLYSIAAYIKKFIPVTSGGKWLIAAILLTLSLPLCAVFIRMISQIYPNLLQHQMYFLSERSPLTLIAAISAFIAALTAKETHSAFINKIAAAMFGIYLFTDNKFIMPILWSKIVGTQAQFYSGFLPLVMLLTAGCVFVSVMLLEMLRLTLVQRPLLQFINSDFCTKRFRRLTQGIDGRILQQFRNHL